MLKSRLQHWSVIGVPRRSNHPVFTDQLRDITDDTKLRNVLTSFKIQAIDGEIAASHRSKVIPVILSLLYGRALSRPKRSAAKSRLKGKRTAILYYIATLDQEELEYFFQLAMHPFLSCLDDNCGSITERAVLLDIPFRSQIGFLNLLRDIIKTFKNRVSPFIPRLLTVLACVVQSADVVSKESCGRFDVEGDEAEEEDDDKEDNEDAEEAETENDFNSKTPALTKPSNTLHKQLRQVRHLGLSCIVDIFNLDVDISCISAERDIVKTLFHDRISKLTQGGTHSMNPTIQLLLVLSRNPARVSLLYDEFDCITPFIRCLSAKSVSTVVFSAVLEFTENIFGRPSDGKYVGETQAESEMKLDTVQVPEEVLTVTAGTFIDQFQALFPTSATTATTSTTKLQTHSSVMRLISILLTVSKLNTDGRHALAILNALLPHLERPNRQVPEKVKGEILQICRNFVAAGALSEDVALEFISHLNPLFSSAATVRPSLTAAYQAIAQFTTTHRRVADLLVDLNARSRTYLDEPDFDLQLEAHARINDVLYKELGEHEWRPLLHHMLHIVTTSTELVIRASAADGLKRFFDAVALSLLEKNTNEAVQDCGLVRLAHSLVLPAMKRAFRNPDEAVRSEFFAILSHAVRAVPTIPPFAHMTVLLHNEDEANIFNNIYHIQMHRRGRALRRLADHVKNGHVVPSVLANFFIPIISHLFTAENPDLNIVEDAIYCLGCIARVLPWPKYYNTLRFYIQKFQKGIAEKICLRAIISILDGFNFGDEGNIDAMDIEGDRDDDGIDGDEEEGEDNNNDNETNKGITAREKIKNQIMSTVIPQLQKILSLKKSLAINNRVPVALAITKVLKHMPEESFNDEFPRLLMNLVNLLKSREQECRDAARSTLLNVVGEVGPSKLSTVMIKLTTSWTADTKLTSCCILSERF